MDRLTRRERQIAELVARGRQNKEIAAELSINESTVKNHVTNLMNKIGVRNRTELAIRWQRPSLWQRLLRKLGIY
jgi:DNA-binding NarL/FixJ family response regulator